MTSTIKYNSNAEITYVFYDTKYIDILRNNLNIVVSRDTVGEFENDFDVINVLYARELEYVLDISGIDNIATRCMELFEVINKSSLSTCLDMLASRPQMLPIVLTGDTTPSSTDSVNITRGGVLPMLFSYDLLFFTHICLRDLFNDGDIKPEHLETLCDAIREYI
jgi:hypothetical protein